MDMTFAEEKESAMSYKTSHPEQDPAEGSRDIVERELARQANKQDSSHDNDDKNASLRPVSDEAAHRAMKQHRM